MLLYSVSRRLCESLGLGLLGLLTKLMTVHACMHACMHVCICVPVCACVCVYYIYIIYVRMFPELWMGCAVTALLAEAYLSTDLTSTHLHGGIPKTLKFESLGMK